jgi:hypothetical protein
MEERSETILAGTDCSEGLFILEQIKELWIVSDGHECGESF